MNIQEDAGGGNLRCRPLVGKLTTNAPMSRFLWESDMRGHPPLSRQAQDADMSDLHDLACRVLELAGEKNLSFVTAESCTAGKLAALLSEAPGAAKRLHGSFVAYTKANKTRALGVPADLLAEQGAVCPAVAAAMAEGALAHSPADIAVSITGVAGPDPDEDGNPVGRVCIGLARNGMTRALRYDYGDPGREAVQQCAIADALRVLIAALEEP
jgi:nicotinamide-nucleotide amidase